VRAAASGRTYLDPALGARLAAPSHDPYADIDVGSVFAGHRIDDVVGKGGMGVVYRATDLALDRRVALKVVAPGVARDPVFRARFMRECRLAAGLDHPHVVPIFHAGEDSGRLYVTMRFVDGSDLRTLLKGEGPLDPPRAVGLIEQVAAALDEAHGHGLVHRDVKPANILIGNRDNAEHVFLADFGISKHRATEPGLTFTGIAIGTPDYMAPEQAEARDVDGRADIYSLGCVLFQALSGHIPFERDSDVDKLWAHVHEPPPPLETVRPGLPQALDAALSRALAKDPGDRHQSAGAFAREVLAALEG
jgi:serine/threonine-protein kinase